MLEDDVPKEDIGEMLADFDLDGDGNIHFEGQSIRGGARIFIGGGGGGARKRLCARTHITNAEPNSINTVKTIAVRIYSIFTGNPCSCTVKYCKFYNILLF